jgi:hypothetical protein
MRIHPNGGVGIASSSGNGSRGLSVPQSVTTRSIEIVPPNPSIQPNFNIVYGSYFRANASNLDYGVAAYALSQEPDPSFENIGAYGQAQNSDDFNAGIFGRVNCWQGLYNNWAAQFNGNVMITGQLDPPSDINLKTNISGINEDEANSVLQLNPYSYHFNPEINTLLLDTTLQFGVLAQEVAPLFPTLVRETTTSGRRDEEGNLVSEDIDHLCVAYMQLIPLLVAKYQVQSTQLESQNLRITELKQRFENAKQNLKTKKELKDLSLKLYPNPTRGQVTLEIESTEIQNVRISLRHVDDFNESLIFRGEIYDQQIFQIDLTSEKSGLYLIMIETQNDQKVLKLLKQVQ